MHISLEPERQTDDSGQKATAGSNKKGSFVMKWSFIVALVIMSALISYAADINGTWKGTMETPMGAMENTITLQADGAKLSGLVKTDMFESKIENGALKDNKVSFIINMDFGTLTYEGTLDGDDLKLNVTGPDGSPTALNCKRQK
jgi:hypothetical protein